MPSSAISFTIPFPERYRLVVADVDGTLLDSRHQLPERVAAAARKIQQHDIAVALATGKMLVAVSPLVEAMRLRGPQITLNGAALVLAQTGEPLVYSPLRAEDRRFVIETVRRAAPEVLITHFMLDDILLDQPDHPLLSVLLAYGEKRITPVPSLLADDVPPAAKILVVGTRAQLADLRRAVTPIFASRVVITTTAPDFLEFFDLAAGKGHGLATLLDTLNVPGEAVIAIGDGENDIPLFAHAGLAVAMGNASASVQAAANLVIGSNDEAGVAAFLDALLQARVARQAPSHPQREEG
ncbi:MAG TPA: HAD family hydrolase [Ktedonobacterales bacterium]|nr:HAD family hydrolase [Ktedonobacterales bacterium]